MNKNTTREGNSTLKWYWIHDPLLLGQLKLSIKLLHWSSQLVQTEATVVLD